MQGNIMQSIGSLPILGTFASHTTIKKLSLGTLPVTALLEFAEVAYKLSVFHANHSVPRDEQNIEDTLLSCFC